MITKRYVELIQSCLDIHVLFFVISFYDNDVMIVHVFVLSILWLEKKHTKKLLNRAVSSMYFVESNSFDGNTFSLVTLLLQLPVCLLILNN